MPTSEAGAFANVVYGSSVQWTGRVTPGKIQDAEIISPDGKKLCIMAIRIALEGATTGNTLVLAEHDKMVRPKQKIARKALRLLATCSYCVFIAPVPPQRGTLNNREVRALNARVEQTEEGVVRISLSRTKVCERFASF